MSGFFIAWRLTGSLIPGFGLGSLGGAQPANLFRIGQQRPVNLDAIPCLNRTTVRISDHFAEDPHRAIGQIQLRKRLADQPDFSKAARTVVPAGTVTVSST